MTDSAPGRVADTAVVTPHEIVVQRTARFYTLGPVHGFPRELWIVCHGYGQLAGRFLQQFASMDDGTRLIVAPEALSRFYLDTIATRRHQAAPRIGATWMTREARETEIADYVSYLDRVVAAVRHPLSGAAPRIVVLGFSQGTATVSRWLANSEHRADQLVLWGGTIPPELDLADWAARLQGAPITLVLGESDELVTPGTMIAEAERLAAAGVGYRLVRHPGGHAIEADALAEVDRWPGG